MISSDKNERTDHMSILGRLIRRNILGKPLRSFAIIFALAASAFAMLFCISGREAPEHVLRDTMLRVYGGAELLAIDSNSDLKLNAADFPENTKIYLSSGLTVKAKTAKGEYDANAAYHDTKVGKQLGLFSSELDPENGVIISEAFSQKTGLKECDSVTIKAVGLKESDMKRSKTLSLKVVKVSNDKYLLHKPNTVMMNIANIKKLTANTGTGYKTALIDLPDDVDVKEFSIDIAKKYVKQNYGFSPILTDELLEDISKQTMVFYLIFAVILLMTLFLTFSMSRHIANERLSTIGTLRSIGGSIPKTSTLLIIESVVYGLVGGIIGAVLFVFAGDFAVRAFFGSTGNYSMPLWLYPASVLLAVAIQIICQSGALIKAVRTPVRDIIFSSKDSVYVLSVKKLIIGAVLFAAGITVGIIADETMFAIAAIALICVGSVMVVPLVIKGLSKLFVKMFAALGMSTAKFAANECAYKKSSVTSTQLTFIALAISTGILIVSSAVAASYESDIYHYDVKAEVNKSLDKCKFITELSEVSEYELFMQTALHAEVNGGKKELVSFVAYTSFKLHPIIKGADKAPADGEVYIGKDYAKKHSLKEGDVLDIVDTDDFIINNDGVGEYPRYKLTVAGIYDVVTDYRDTLFVNEKWYTKELSNSIENIYINLSKNSSVEDLTEKIQNKLPNVDVVTAQQSMHNSAEDRSQVMTIIYSILGVGVVLALLGAVSNAIIGFEQSKRKYAVLHSVAAGKKKLSKLIILETLFSSLTAGLTGLALGCLLTGLIETALDNMGMVIVVKFDPALMLMFVLAMTALLMLSAVKPIVSLRKMNTAAELKYE